MHLMRFDFRDMFRAPRLALSIQRIWIQFVGFVVGFLGYWVLTYLSFAISGIGISVGWKKYGLLPCLMGEQGNWISYIVFAIGIIWLIVVYLVTATAVSRATYMLLKGNNFYTWREAFCFSSKKIWSLILSPVSLVILIALIAFGGAVVGWLGRIPYVGEFGVTIFTPIWMFASLLLVFMAIVVVIAALLSPAILATTDDDAFEAVFQSFSLVWSQPWRLIFYQVINGILAIFAFFVLAYLSKKAFIVMDRIFAATMGADYQNISAHAMYLLSVWVAYSIVWLEQLIGNFAPWIYFSREFVPLNLPMYQIVAAHIFAVWMFIVGGYVVSYGLSSLNVGHTLAYLILRKKKDDENLLERKDREEEEEEEEPEATPDGEPQQKADKK
ncbi:MAG: hypothetical protein GXO74_02180 [Calditrichaeota bacterium]|nr:hypothetical protein [Calditrichota bacterium]